MSALIGIVLGLCAAVFKSSKSVLTKIAATGLNTYVTSFWTRMVGVALFFILIVLFGDFYTPSDSTYWIALVTNSILLSLTTLIFTRALEVSDISLISPIMSLLPVFTVPPAILFLNETPSIIGFFGLVSITVGAYVISSEGDEYGILDPIIMITDDRGVQLAVAGLVIASAIPAVDKVGIQSTDPLLWVFSTHICTSIVLLGVLLGKKELPFDDRMKNNGILLAVGLSSSIIWVFQSYAYTFTQVAYVSGVKRVSIVFSIIAGYYIFGEQNIRRRLGGAVFLIIGILLVATGIS